MIQGFNSILLQVGLIPTWLAPVQPRSFFIHNKWETLYNRLKSDVVAIISPSNLEQVYMLVTPSADLSCFPRLWGANKQARQHEHV